MKSKEHDINNTFSLSLPEFIFLGKINKCIEFYLYSYAYILYIHGNVYIYEYILYYLYLKYVVTYIYIIYIIYITYIYI